MTHTFQSLGLLPALQDTLLALGYVQPTPIQAQAIPLLLSGRDLLGQAQTGTGKTAAFTLPIVQQLEGDGLQMLVLTPTRELAIQVAEAVYRYGNQLGIRVLPVYGGESYERQERRLQKGVHVVVGTPGRTLDLIRRRTLDLSNVRFVVLDEADEMLKMGFIDDVEAILSKTDTENRQTALFSATFSPEIRAIAAKYMKNPLHVAIEAQERTAEGIVQSYYLVNEGDKLAALCRVLAIEDRLNTLIFARTRVGAAELAEQLVERGFSAIAIHGDLAQNERERILRRFREGSLSILVGTDVVGRGVDITDVSHVINYDVPQLPIEYVHRIGRTGRAGRTGEAITFITPKQRRTLQLIEKYTQKTITRAKLPTREDVLERRESDFLARILNRIEGTTESDALLQALGDSGYPVEQIVSGLVQMLRAQEKHFDLDHVRNINEESRQDRGGRFERSGERSGRGDRSERSSGERGERSDRPRSRRERGSEQGMVRLLMDVGRNKGIRPADVVYGIASSANIPGSDIGAIDIRQNETYLDVPEKHVDAVLKVKQSRIRGQAFKLVRA